MQQAVICHVTAVATCTLHCCCSIWWHWCW